MKRLMKENGLSNSLIRPLSINRVEESDVGGNSNLSNWVVGFFVCSVGGLGLSCV